MMGDRYIGNIHHHTGIVRELHDSGAWYRLGKAILWPERPIVMCPCVSCMVFDSIDVQPMDKDDTEDVIALDGAKYVS